MTTKFQNLQENHGFQQINGSANFALYYRQDTVATQVLLQQNGATIYTGSGVANNQFVNVAYGHYDAVLIQNGTVSDTMPINIGDVYLCGGQSNTVSNLQPSGYSPARPSSANKVFISQYYGQGSHVLVDAYDCDLTQSGGICWIACGIALNRPWPVIFINVAQGNTSIADWANNLSGRLTDGLYRYYPKAILFTQGETNAVLGTTQSSYTETLLAILDSIRTISVVPWLIALDGAGSSAVRTAQDYCITVRPTIAIYGPDADATTRGDTLHPTDLEFYGANISLFGSSWATAINNAGL